MLIMPDDMANRLIKGREIKDREGNSLVIVTQVGAEGEHKNFVCSNDPSPIKRASTPTPEIRKVEGYDNRFMVTEDGQLVSTVSNKILSQCESNEGYLNHATKIGGRNGKSVLLRTHRLVAEAFVPNPDNKPFVNHDDGVKTNNCKNNLEWSTNQENIKHAFDNGLAHNPKGHDSPSSKLTPQQVEEIKKLKGTTSTRKAAPLFNVSRSVIADVWNGKRYNSD